MSVLVSVADAICSNFLLHPQLEMEPMAGIEPATDGLRNRCSTAELHWLTTIENKAFYASILTGFLGACILNLYMACFFCYEDQHTNTDQAQNRFGLGQNAVS